ncbi:aldehyde-activating protein [Acuticoccus sediminis]|uniref:Aldehyde-activating protein n=1 Tax=Acuticoccus sediminis TaxID=2184697 RepID=A0A8B2NPN4_9HYPH|nr:GFA family protein [Acuticoccus sediminis]RAH97743.1 aldehyde-activating protein [Acuticoccus sediminis]
METETAGIAASGATGGCLCGAVRFVVAGPIGPAAYCHCSDCRRTTGSAFNVSIGVPVTSFALLSGTPKGFTATAESGNALTRHFCPDCGAPLYTSSPHHPDRIFVKAGAFDDHAVVAPAHQSWMRSRVAWAGIDPDLPAYDRDRPAESGA